MVLVATSSLIQPFLLARFAFPYRSRYLFSTQGIMVILAAYAGAMYCSSHQPQKRYTMMASGYGDWCDSCMEGS